MKLGRTLGFVSSAALVPALASAQPPAVAPYNQPAPPPSMAYAPEGEEVYDQWNGPVFAAGAVVFLGSYGASAIVADQSDHIGADRLWAPIVGPWFALNNWGDCTATDQPSRCTTNATDKFLLAADGVFQAAGIITMIGGLVMPSHHRVLVHTAHREIHVTPTHNGVAVFGRF